MSPRSAGPLHNPVAAKPADANPKPAPGRMFVVGRVLDPQGKPVPNATVMVYARSGDRAGHAYCRIELDCDRIGAGQRRLGPVPARRPAHLVVAARRVRRRSPCAGLRRRLGRARPRRRSARRRITLRPEQVIQGRLFDLQGQPAGASRSSVAADRPRPHSGSSASRSAARRFEGPSFWWTRADDMPGLAQPAITDADGRFTVHGVGRPPVVLTSSIRGSPSQDIEIEHRRRSGVEASRSALQPARIVTGRVTYADTGKPVPHARLQIAARIDRVNGRSSDRSSRPTPTGASAPIPCPATTVTVDGLSSRRAALPERLDRAFDWPKGAIEQSVDLALPRGVLIRGKVTEEGSGKPVAGATVIFVSHAVERSTRLDRLQPARPRLRPTARSSSRSCPARATSSSWLPATITCSGRSASGCSSGPAGRPAHLCPRLHRLRPEAGRRRPGRQRRCFAGRRP